MQKSLRCCGVQIEIFEELVNKRKENDDEFFTPAEVTEFIKKNYEGKDINRGRVAWALAQLEATNYVDAKVISKSKGSVCRAYRVKAQYVVQEEE